MEIFVINFIQTRGVQEGFKEKVGFSEAILSPSASYGGLYAPESVPDFGSKIERYKDMSYKEMCLDILGDFGIDIDTEVLKNAVSLYDEFDDKNNPVPVVKIKDDLYISELYHGPTRAFKDMALQPFGVVFSSLAQKRGENYIILAATSGDTGPATLETFANRENIKVICLYPDGGTSDVQRLQMVTESAPNLNVIGIKGNFDDAQNALKNLLANSEFKGMLKEKNLHLSAANSVNFGRIIFQIIYHIHSYISLLKDGAISPNKKINLIVPSGNFGNALGALYAKMGGIPIGKIYIASNSNNILSELINNGEYDLRNKELIKTTSPAMDILISSNVERILFTLFGATRTKELMEKLSKDRFYKLESDELLKLQNYFGADFSTDEFASSTIAAYAKDGYLMDPHTATAIKVYEKNRDGKEIFVAYSTAEWTKFSPMVYQALFGESCTEDKVALDKISKELNITVHRSIASLFDKKITQTTVVDKEKIVDTIISLL